MALKMVFSCSVIARPKNVRARTAGGKIKVEFTGNCGIRLPTLACPNHCGPAFFPRIACPSRRPTARGKIGSSFSNPWKNRQNQPNEELVRHPAVGNIESAA